jgi:hypothetical protein
MASVLCEVNSYLSEFLECRQTPKLLSSKTQGSPISDRVCHRPILYSLPFVIILTFTNPSIQDIPFQRQLLELLCQLMLLWQRWIKISTTLVRQISNFERETCESEFKIKSTESEYNNPCSHVIGITFYLSTLGIRKWNCVKIPYLSIKVVSKNTLKRQTVQYSALRVQGIQCMFESMFDLNFSAVWSSFCCSLIWFIDFAILENIGLNSFGAKFLWKTTPLILKF